MMLYIMYNNVYVHIYIYMYIYIYIIYIYIYSHEIPTVSHVLFPLYWLVRAKMQSCDVLLEHYQPTEKPQGNKQNTLFQIDRF